MYIFYKYVIREHVAPFFFAFSVIMFVLILKLMLEIVTALISKGVEILVLTKIFAYSLAYMVALVVPMSVLVATVMAFGRMGAASEIIAMKAAGISMYRIVAPILVISALIAFGMVWFNNTILPEANYRASNLSAAVFFKKPFLTFNNREGQFINDIPSVTIRVESIDYSTEELKGISLFRSFRGFYQDLIVAETGRFITHPDSAGLTLLLRNGEVHHVDSHHPERYVRVEFKEFSQNFSMDSRLDTGYRNSRNDRTMLSSMMSEEVKKFQAENTIQRRNLLRKMRGEPVQDDSLRILQNIKINNRQIASFKVEMNKRDSIPFAAIIFVLLGAPLGILVKRSGASIGIGISIGFFAVYYLFLSGGESAGDRMLIPPWLSMWAPNIIMGIMGLFLFRYAARR
ncbi:MAG: LptF/LptG family permease [Candidatus Latescibacter sp.]|nr:LptF/LptG family permease [Candidatus Latescibacter sp.]